MMQSAQRKGRKGSRKSLQAAAHSFEVVTALSGRVVKFKLKLREQVENSDLHEGMDEQPFLILISRGGGCQTEK